MATSTKTAPAITRVFVHPRSAAGEHYRAGRETGARAHGFPAEQALNLRYFGGKTIEKLTFTHVYLGGKAAWNPADVQNIDRALPAAMSDPHLNNVISQYYADEKSTTTFKPSRFLEGALPSTVYKDTIEHLVATLDQANGLSGFDLTSSVFCFMLPPGVVLVDGDSKGHQERHDDDDEAEVQPGARRGGRGRRLQARPRRLPRLGPCQARLEDGHRLLRGRRLLRGEQRDRRLRRAVEERLRDLLPRAQRGAYRSRRRGCDQRRRHAGREQVPRLVLGQGRRDRRHPDGGGRRGPQHRDEGGAAEQRARHGADPAHVEQRRLGPGGPGREAHPPAAR